MTESNNNEVQAQVYEHQDKRAEPITEQELFDKFKVIFNEILTLEEDLADLADQGKNSGLEDVALIKKIAKASASQKAADLEEKAQALIDKIDELNA
jgi:hypothetical protein